MTKALFPTDGSPLCEQAIERGLEFVAGLGGSAHFLYVLEDPLMTYSAMYGDVSYHPELVQDLQRAAEDAVARAKELAAKVGVPATGEIIAHTSPAAAIHGAEKDVDLVVIGTHGRQGIGRIVFGSVTESALRHAAKPYLVIRLHEEAKTAE